LPHKNRICGYLECDTNFLKKQFLSRPVIGNPRRGTDAGEGAIGRSGRRLKGKEETVKGKEETRTEGWCGRKLK